MSRTWNTPKATSVPLHPELSDDDGFEPDEINPWSDGEDDTPPEREAECGEDPAMKEALAENLRLKSELAELKAANIRLREARDRVEEANERLAHENAWLDSKLGAATARFLRVQDAIAGWNADCAGRAAPR